MRQLLRAAVQHWRGMAVLVIALSLIGPQAPPVVQAQVALPDPRALAITADEAGPGLAITIDEAGGDDQVRWARLRWERDPEATTAVATDRVVENRVWVTADLQAAQDLFVAEAAKQTEFPEAATQPQGPFELAVGPIAEEVVALSACDDCMSRRTPTLHHRVVMRNGPMVAILYTSGIEAAATQTDMSWLAARVGSRLSGAALAGASDTGSTPSADASMLVRALPRDLAITAQEAGGDAVLIDEHEGADARSTWYLARYERPGSSDIRDTGSSVIVNDVLVGRDVVAAREIYAEQIERSMQFPEARAGRIGETSSLDVGPVGDEAQGLMACDGACTTDGEGFVHLRLVSRTGNVVSVVYQHGPRRALEGQVTRTRDVSRLVAARALAASTTVSDDAQDETAVAGDAPVLARPHDLAVKLIEAGKDAELAESGGGSDDRASWYFVRYERPQTYAGFRSGPVTVFNQVLVARNTTIAEELFAEQATRNESFPEAWNDVGEVFAFETGEIGDAVTGLAACTGSCNTRNQDLYLHKRLVTRTDNVVNVIYFWGLDHPDGLTAWHTEYFASLVDARAASSQATSAADDAQP